MSGHQSIPSQQSTGHQHAWTPSPRRPRTGGGVIGFPSSSLTLGGDLSLHCSRTCSPARGPCTELQLGSFFDNQNDPFPAISPPPLFCTAKLQRGPVGPNLSQLTPPPEVERRAWLGTAGGGFPPPGESPSHVPEPCWSADT